MKFAYNVFEDALNLIKQVFFKAMAEMGKLYGEQPTLTETTLYKARKHLYKEERYNRSNFWICNV